MGGTVGVSVSDGQELLDEKVLVSPCGATVSTPISYDPFSGDLFQTFELEVPK